MNDQNPMQILEQRARRQAESISAPGELRRAVLSMDEDATAQVVPITDARSDSGRSRRRRLLITGAVGVIAVGGGVTAVAILLGDQPSRPELPPACRSEPRIGGPLVVLEPGVDPIEGCGSLWESGVLPDPAQPRPAPQPVPPLVACIGAGGVVEIFPGPADLCDALGLEFAATTLTRENAAVAALNVRLAEEINSSDCGSVEVVERKVLDLLADLELPDWSIERGPGVERSDCVKGEIFSPTRTIRLFSL